MNKAAWIVVVWLWAWLPAPAPAQPGPYESGEKLTGERAIDALVLHRLEELKIPPAAVCSDGVFLRRAYLDVIGTLPTAKEAREFLQDKAPNKRALLIDRLLERDEFADYWAMKWANLLRVKAEFPINLWPNAAQAYSRWIRTAVKANKPYDQFARELLTGGGSNFYAPEVNFYRAVQGRGPDVLAQAVALTFMGERAGKWPKDRLAGLAGFFAQVGYKATAQWKEEIVYWDPSIDIAKATSRPAGAGPVFPDGTPAVIPAGRDPREVFADWLVSPKNPGFAPVMANRVWSWLLGRGIVNEPDDFRPDNPPANPELLALLSREFVAARYDVKSLFRLILNSRTYQLSPLPPSRRPEAAANFAYYPLRPLEAEVLIDALDQITGTSEKYTSAIPEPFTFIPESMRAIALPDGSITSTFLDLFGRPPRDSGLESERTTRVSAAQRLHMLNSSHVQKKIERSWQIMKLGQLRTNTPAAVGEIYLTVLSRFPTAEELKALGPYIQQPTRKVNEAGQDLIWSLINSDEFLYRH
ncbi:MAG: DUF1553 domain-containing protein [Planctomycetota bacterium]|nr:DUF1553 domain-containing protein [Planctomycetota bacterium]